MVNPTLKSQSDVIDDIVNVFLESPRCQVAVREDTAFKDAEYLSLGAIEVFPSADGEISALRAAVQRGMFEWYTPRSCEAFAGLKRCMITPRTGNRKHQSPNEERLSSIVDLFGSIALRNGLRNPAFDPLALQEMPFVKPTTIVCDTSGILHGALNFVSRYLSPVARIKVPAVVHMEIVNLADRFLRNRRAKAQHVRPLHLINDHFLSQIGQRVLLQLELHSNIEVERTLLLGDPLRAAFQQDSELRELNLSVAIRSYVDRLILETARQHRIHAPTGHRLMLLTSDQGLARMALAEGIEPLYFRSVGASAFFDNHFAGTNPHPFSGGPQITSIPEVLWDLATMAGEVKLSATRGPQRMLTIQSISKELKWVPHHSYEDLLWTHYTEPNLRLNSNHLPTNIQQAALDLEESGKLKDRVAVSVENSSNSSDARSTNHTHELLLKFNVSRLVRLIDDLDSRQELSINEVLSSLEVKQSNLRDYRRFLESGKALIVDVNRWKATPELVRLAVSIRSNDVDELRNSFMSFQIFRALRDYFKKHQVGAKLGLSKFGRANLTYRTLAEITGIGAPVYDVGFYATPQRPTAVAFADVGLRVFDRLKQEGDWIATGQWLEELIMSEGIHPLYARKQLQACSESGLVRRTTEGSTSETAYDRHTLRVVDTTEGVPTIRTEYLYRGDFLIPGKASSSLKLERISQ